MKKNLMMRIASFLLVAVLISTSAISGTYAKYTTQDAGSDEARVAKWGVELQVFGNLYGDSYGTADKIVLDTDGSVTVQTKDTAKDVVAPGTKNAEGFEISLKGQPEVDGTITTTIKTQNIFLKEGTYGIMVPVNNGAITEDNFEEIKEAAAGELFKNIGTSDTPEYVPAGGYEAGAEYYTLEDAVTFSGDYYPVVYNMTGSSTATGVYTADSLANVATVIAGKLGLPVGTTDADHITTITGTTSFQSNDNLADYALNDLKITWAWKFDQDDCELVGDKACVYSKADTILGNLQDNTLNVVVWDDDKYIKVPTSMYCLDTMFFVDIIVTQEN